MSLQRVGQIGLGAVGYHFAHHLLRHFGAVRVYDIDVSRVEMVCALGATPAETAEDLAVECDTILLSLPNPGAVREVLRALLPVASAGTLLVDCSTIDPDTSRWANTECRTRKVDYVEAPVTSAAPGGGSTEGVKAGKRHFSGRGRGIGS